MEDERIGTAKIFVVGSLNIDTFLFVPAMPEPGETVKGRDILLRAGGKGFNQAVAMAKCGSDVTLIGAIGEDEFLFDSILTRNNISHQSLIRKAGPTGQAFIEVDDNGENRIVIIAGANDLLSPEDLLTLDDFASTKHILILAQNEIPTETVESAFKKARTHDWMTVLNTAPARPVSDSLMKLTNILVCNRSEAEYYLGTEIEDPEAIHDEVRTLLKEGPRILIITLGSEGAVLYTNETLIARDSFSVNTIDTTGAGDAFCGGFVSEFSRSQNMEESLNYALATGALATTRVGASDGSPTHQEIIALLKSSGRD
jgi:ribokinase